MRRLQGVVIARSWSLLEYNIPRTKLAEAEKITPGYNSPTINSLEDPNWCAVRVMVPSGKVIDVMEQLEALHVANAREAGWSWQEIATALGVTKQAAHQKHGRR